MEKYCVVLEQPVWGKNAKILTEKIMRITGYSKYDVQEIIDNAPAKIVVSVDYDFAVYISKSLAEFEDIISLNPETTECSPNDFEEEEVLNDELYLDKFIGSEIPLPVGSAYIDSFEFETFQTNVNLLEHLNTSFNEKYFLFLFAGSLSLDNKEKMDILFEKLPVLSQFQVDELIQILEEEKRKFNLLAIRHPDQVIKLIMGARKEWQIIEKSYSV